MVMVCAVEVQVQNTQALEPFQASILDAYYDDDLDNELCCSLYFKSGPHFLST